MKETTEATVLALISTLGKVIVSLVSSLGSGGVNEEKVRAAVAQLHLAIAANDARADAEADDLP